MEKRDTLVTTDGREIRLRPPSHVLFQKIAVVVEKEYRKRGECIDIPQYEAKLAGGESEFHDHDEESIKTATDEEKEQWELYHETMDRMAADISSRQGVFLLREGLVVDNDDLENGDWIAEQQLYGFEIPEDKFDRFTHYVETVLLKTPKDQMDAIIKIQTLMADGVPDDMIESAESFFRAQMVGYTTAEQPGDAMDESGGVVESDESLDGD